MTNAIELDRGMIELARADFRTFVYLASNVLLGAPLKPNWHIDVLIRAAEKVADGTSRRLLACLPPRYLKTHIFSICLPAWLLGRDPRMKIICASYAMSLAENFNLDVMRLMTSDWYRRVFPNTRMSKRKSNVTEFATTAGGFRMASSVGGTLTGRGGDLIIVDNPLKADEAYSETARENCKTWFNRSASTRLNDPKKGAFIVVAQRLHQEDLPGQLIETGLWDEVIIPAVTETRTFYEILKGGKKVYFEPGKILQPERQDADDLAAKKLEMGEQDFEAQFNQRPLPPGGAVFKGSWFKRYKETPDPRANQAIVQSWDTAFETGDNNDYSACTTWAVSYGSYYLIDAYRAKLKFWELEKKILQMQRKFRANIVIVEKAGAGHSLFQNIHDLQGHRWMVAMPPERAKIVRAEVQSPKVQRGDVWLPTEAPWLAAFEHEVLGFPFTKFDDQVDSMVQFLGALDYMQVKLRIEGKI